MSKEITIQKILSILLGRIKFIILLTVVVTLVAFGYTKFFVKPTYSASAIILVQNFDNSEAETQPNTGEVQRVWSSDLTSSATLANYCSVLFLNSPKMTEILNGCSLSITSENETNFLRVTVSCGDPKKAADVANQVAQAAPDVFIECYKAGSIITIREASQPSAPSSPNVMKNTLFGFLVGLVLSVLLALFFDIIDTTIKPDDDLFKLYGIPVLAEIMDFERKE